jgi:hypothetical protein
MRGLLEAAQTGHSFDRRAPRILNWIEGVGKDLNMPLDVGMGRDFSLGDESAAAMRWKVRAAFRHSGNALG